MHRERPDFMGCFGPATEPRCKARSRAMPFQPYSKWVACGTLNAQQAATRGGNALTAGTQRSPGCSQKSEMVTVMKAIIFALINSWSSAHASAGRNARFEIAAAKCRASEAVEKLTRLSHQVHGAIGFTYEYGLHFLTRRLWAWRAEFGGAGEWGEYLGRIAAEVGGDGIWPTITA